VSSNLSHTQSLPIADVHTNTSNGTQTSHPECVYQAMRLISSKQNMDELMSEIDKYEDEVY